MPFIIEKFWKTLLLAGIFFQSGKKSYSKVNANHYPAPLVALEVIKKGINAKEIALHLNQGIR